jgi:hypothetical protein
MVEKSQKKTEIFYGFDFSLNKRNWVCNIPFWVDSRFNGANLLVVSSELTWSSAVSDSSLILLYWLSVSLDFVKKMFESKSFAYYKIVHD